MSRVDDEEQRWVEAGRVLRRVNPQAFEGLLAAAEVTIVETPEVQGEEGSA